MNPFGRGFTHSNSKPLTPLRGAVSPNFVGMYEVPRSVMYVIKRRPNLRL